MSATSQSQSPATERPTLRKKLSRKFSSLTLKRSSSRKAEAVPPVPHLDRKSSVSSSSTITDRIVDSPPSTPRAPVDAETAKAIISYAYPLWRVDPALVGCFVVL
ncbi:hypothetical protein K466DRAFT_594078 [Polyporus arcularius HHB13444]|uniref:Uncharacterized protein n=2 Tax=Polyporaceae TaxID=5317 RepID=A0A5C3Q0U1_9APHY|nr:hypothetical protein OH76DRAFT_1485673 [Polyporus brumalis]TFK93788.1 hypothetical protein K466DRAFT_594078 [Polyporus arcularius HHB13444]